MRGHTGSHVELAQQREGRGGTALLLPSPAAFGDGAGFFKAGTSCWQGIEEDSAWQTQPSLASPDDFSREELQKMGDIPEHSSATVLVLGASQGSARQCSVLHPVMLSTLSSDSPINCCWGVTLQQDHEHCDVQHRSTHTSCQHGSWHLVAKGTGWAGSCCVTTQGSLPADSQSCAGGAAERDPQPPCPLSAPSQDKCKPAAAGRHWAVLLSLHCSPQLRDIVWSPAQVQYE